MRLRSAFRLLLLMFALAGGHALAETEGRVALVVGNARYAKVPALANPGNDASDIAAALARLGFSVTRIDDAGYEAMRRGLRDFSRKAAGANMAIVYFAGHGIEMGGENYLIPVDAELGRDTDIEHEAITLKSVMATVEGARQLGLVILDSCRNNPFAAKMAKSGTATRAIGRGLARIEPAGSVLVAFAAKDGTTALDGEGRNSPFTKALLKHLETPDLEINFLFRGVRDDVVAATGRSQEPFVYGSLSRAAIFLKRAPTRVTSAAPADATPRPPAAPLFSGDPGKACDAAAAYEHDTKRPAGVAAVANGKVDGPVAVAACQAAIAKYPGEPRYEYHLARGYFATGNIDLTIEFSTRSAKRGYGAAACTVGQMLTQGTITRGHHEFAMRWYEIGMRAGEYECANNLAVHYLNGLGTAANPTKAVALFRIAAERGYGEAQVSLGFLLSIGVGATRDVDGAIRLYEAAVRQGHPQAMNNLAMLLRRQAPNDLARPTELLLAAFRAGNATARENLTEKWPQLIDETWRRAIEQRLVSAGLLNRAATGAFGADTMAALQGLLVAQ